MAGTPAQTRSHWPGRLPKLKRENDPTAIGALHLPDLQGINFVKKFVSVISMLLLSLVCHPVMAMPIAAELPDDAAIQISYGDRRVGTVASAPRSFSTNAFWIEGPNGLILVDTMFLLSDAEQALDFAEKATGKKVVMAIILHPNPDKFNGALVQFSPGTVTNSYTLAGGK